jgi:hypothetical protein
MNIITLLKEFRSLIHESGAVQAWCQINYKTGLASTIGLDERNPPVTGAPLIHLFPVSKVTGFRVDPKQHVVGITCSIFDESPAVVVYEGASEYEAVARVEEFRELVSAAIRTTKLEGLLFQDITTHYETVEFFPNFYVTMGITIEETRDFRDDPYE